MASTSMCVHLDPDQPDQELLIVANRAVSGALKLEARCSTGYLDLVIFTKNPANAALAAAALDGTLAEMLRDLIADPNLIDAIDHHGLEGQFLTDIKGLLDAKVDR